MKPFFYLLLITFLLSSCITSEKCQRRYPPQVTTLVKDSIIEKTSTIYKDSLVYLKLNPDTVTLIQYEHYSNPDDPTIITIDSISAENRFCVAWSWVDDSQLGLSLIQKDTLLAFKLDSAIRISNYYRELYHSELNKEVQQIRYIPRFYRFCSVYFFITATAFVILLIVKLKKFLPF